MLVPWRAHGCRFFPLGTYTWMIPGTVVKSKAYKACVNPPEFKLELGATKR